MLRKSVAETENRIRENAVEAEKNRSKQSQLAERIQSGEKNAGDLEKQINDLKEKVRMENQNAAMISEENRVFGGRFRTKVGKQIKAV